MKAKTINTMNYVTITKVANGWVLRSTTPGSAVESLNDTYVYQTIPQLAEGLRDLLVRANEPPTTPAGRPNV